MKSDDVNDHVNTEGSQVAYAALLKATLALNRMEDYEKNYASNSGAVMKLLFSNLVLVCFLICFLVADKMGWIY